MNQYTIIPFLAKNRKAFILIIFSLFLFLVYTEWVSMFSRLDGKKQAETTGSGPCAQKSLSLNGCSRWQSGPSEKPGLIFVIVFHNTADCTREVVKSLKAKDDDFEGLVKINQALDKAQIGPLVSEWTAFVADSTSKVVKVVFNGQINTVAAKAYINEAESTERDAIHREWDPSGAVSWGFSMLLHRLKLYMQDAASSRDDEISRLLLKAANVELRDLSEPQDNAEQQMMELIERAEMTYDPTEKEDLQKQLAALRQSSSKGSRVYGHINEPKQPYTYHFTVSNAVIPVYNYDLTSENYGSEYAQDEPC